MYGGATLWSLVMTTLHAQNRHRLSQKGRCMYSETGVRAALAVA